MHWPVVLTNQHPNGLFVAFPQRFQRFWVVLGRGSAGSSASADPPSWARSTPLRRPWTHWGRVFSFQKKRAGTGHHGVGLREDSPTPKIRLWSGEQNDGAQIGPVRCQIGAKTDRFRTNISAMHPFGSTATVIYMKKHQLSDLAGHWTGIHHGMFLLKN